jgi:AcrR family transcriptional regulator
MPTQPRGEGTHSRILRAAADCFARQGYDGTGVAEICERAGVTKGAFYHHFETKQLLFLALLEEWLAGLDTQLAQARTQTASLPEALRQMVARAGASLEIARGQVPLFLEFWSKASRDPIVWQATIDPYRRYHLLIAGLVEQGVAEGSLRPVNPNSAAHLLLSLAVGMLLQGLLDPAGADWVAVAQDSLDMVLQGLGPRPSVG